METLLSIGLLFSIISPHTTIAASPRITPEAPVVAQVDTLALQEAWISKLAMCESGDRDYAINPKDLDGTASYSTFQFKVTTYEWLLDKYDIPSAPIFSSTTQRAIVRRMINDPQINLKNQFPDCVRKLGLPK